MRVELKDLLFWIFLVVAMSLLLWSVFGHSPTEFFTIVGIIFALVLKVWGISDNQIKSDAGVKGSFQKIKNDMSLIREDVDLIKSDTGLIKKKLKV